MQKSRLGISIGLLGAGMFLTCFFGGYVISIILAGYILLCEENLWIKKTAVRAVALMFGFSLLSALINLIPNAMNFINSVCNIFDGSFYIEVISEIITMVGNAISIIQKVLFIILGLKALNQGTVKIPLIDSLVNKYMD